MLLIRKGAEADLYQDVWHGLNTIHKVRRAKAYRIPQLDLQIRSSRTSHEAQIIHNAKRVGVPTPFMYLIDLETTTITMQYVEGPRMREALGSLSSDQKEKLGHHVGELLGRLHVGGIVHGDVTTSNIIISGEKVFLIDFGLAEYSHELEKRGIDLLLIKRSLQAMHYVCAKECFDAMVRGYTSTVGENVCREVLKRVEEIAKRGRYAVKR